MTHIRQRGWCVLLAAGIALAPHIGWCEPKVQAEPKLLSVYPFGGSIGTELKAEVRGTALEGAYGVWFDSDGLTATVERIDVVEPSEHEKKSYDKKKGKAEPKQKAVLAVRISDTAESGVHRLRLVTPQGLSDSLVFRVHRQPAIEETEQVHSSAEAAQWLKERPIAVNGKIGAKGEVDYYQFEADAGEQLLFEVYAGTAAMDPTVTLFAPTGSWLNPARLTRLAYNNEPVHFPGYSNESRLTYRFDKAGRYLLRVEAFLGAGSADHVYQLRVSAADSAAAPKTHRTRFRPAQTLTNRWEERDFTRELPPNHMDVLWSRSVEPPAADATENEAEDEPNKTKPVFSGPIPVTRVDPDAGLVEVTLPAMIEGAIERAGNIDRVRFEAKRGDRVALEIQTTDATAPDFNPFLKVVDENGLEVFTNIHSNLNNNGGFIMKTVQPKTTFTFRRDGKFTLEIRDVTTQAADDRLAYRVLLRPQVPHVGAVHIAEDHLNLNPGEVKKISIVTDQEEGFDGYIGLVAEGLPQGVRTMMATEVTPVKPPPLNDGKKHRYVAKNQIATLLVVADADAPATTMPSKVKIKATPVRAGRMGKPVEVKELLVMVLQPATTVSQAGSAQAQAAR